jgi:preprotein translocase subunit SecD
MAEQQQEGMDRLNQKLDLLIANVSAWRTDMATITSALTERIAAQKARLDAHDRDVERLGKVHEDDFKKMSDQMDNLVTKDDLTAFKAEIQKQIDKNAASVRWLLGILIPIGISLLLWVLFHINLGNLPAGG